MLLLATRPCARSRRPPHVLLPLALAALLAAPADGQFEERVVDGEPALIVLMPDKNLEMMDFRVHAQELTRDDFGVFVDFRFTDALAESGIDFLHRVVDDAGKTWKPAHYDHGNGLLVADVDGDRVLDVYFLNQVGSNALYRGLGDGRFADVTERAGVAVADRISVTGAFADYDNDGDADLFVTTVREGNLLFQNDGTGRFTDVTEAAGVGYAGHSSGVNFVDFDLDGDLDLFVTNVGVYTGSRLRDGGFYEAFEDAFSGHVMSHRTETSLLYRNRGDGTFEEVSEALGLVDGSWSGDLAFTDIDGDRYPDLYVLNMQGDDHLWVNQGGTRFVERLRDFFPKNPWGAMGIQWFDWNNDGRQDLYLTDMHSDMSFRVTPGYEKVKSMIVGWGPEYIQGGDDNVFGNAFYENRGNGEFVEISDRIGAENYWPWGLSVGDLNADGWRDAFLASSMNFPFRYGVNSVLLNDRGERFRDAELLLGVEPRAETHTPWFELDCSGPDRNHNLCRGRAGRTTVYGARGTRSSAIFDLDGDGDQDILTSEFHDVPQVLLSDLAEQRPVRWVAIDLEGTRSNRDGLGAVVQVTTDRGAYWQVHDGKSGYLSQSSMPLWFGLGEATRIEHVDVTWPSGAQQRVVGVELNALREIVEPR